MSLENNPDLSGEQYDTPLTDMQKEMLRLVEIQSSLSRIADLYKHSQQLTDRFEGYTFVGDLNNSGILLTAELPRAIRSWIERGMTLQDAEIDFRVGSGEGTRTGIVISFSLEQDATEKEGDKHMIVRSVHGLDEPSTVTRIDLETGRITEDKFDVVSENEAYAFIVSVASRNDSDLVHGYLSNQDQFRTYLHNPFSLSDIHSRLDPLSERSRHETYHRLPDPTTGLDIDLTLAHLDDNFIAIEAELWDDQEKSGNLSVSMAAESLDPSRPNDEDNYDEGFFGVAPPRVPKHFEESPLRFIRDGMLVTPSLNDLEEISERLAIIVGYASPAFSAEEVTDYDYDSLTGERSISPLDEEN